MHSHDRTLLASLGFSDPDKTNALHGLACRYITEKEQALRLFSMYQKNLDLTQDLIFVDRSLERPINKGTPPRYVTTVGFLLRPPREARRQTWAKWDRNDPNRPTVEILVAAGALEDRRKLAMYEMRRAAWAAQKEKK